MKDKWALASTPPMGWTSYDCFGGKASEADVKANVDYQAEHMLKYGWEYVVIDIAWYAEYASPRPAYPIKYLNMDEYGRVIPSPSLYPSSIDGKGFKPLADYIHSKGQKLGIHIMRGIPRAAVEKNLPIFGTNYHAADIADTSSTCPWWEWMWGIDASKPGAQEYYDSIMKLYAEWGVDFIKADDTSFPCREEGGCYADDIRMISTAIDNCGRDMVLSLSPGPAPLADVEIIKKYAHTWRLSADLWDRWSDVYKNFEYCEQWNEHRSIGHWPDLDMIPIGKLEIYPGEDFPDHIERMTRLTHDEQLTMMTLWYFFRSLLMVGANLPENDEWTLSLLNNEEVIHIVHNSHSTRQLYRVDDHVAWAAADDDGNTFLALFNLTEETAEMGATLEQMGLKGTYKLRDLWQRQDLGTVDSAVSAEIPPHGVKLFKLSPMG